MNHYFSRSRTVVALGLALSTVTVVLRSMEAENAPSSEKNKTYNPDAGAMLIHATEQGSLSGVEAALLSGADPNLCYGNNQLTALHSAAYDGKLKIMEALINAGANVNKRNKEDETPLHKATWNRKTDAVQLLISSGAQINVANDKGNTPLHFAVTAQTSELTKLLIAAGADIEARSNEIDVIAQCIDKSGNINIASHWTPFLYAAARGDSHQVIQVLLDKGANRRSRDCRDRTALDIVEKRLSEINFYLDMSNDNCRKVKYNVEQVIRVLKGEQPLPEYRSVTTTSAAPSSQLPQAQIRVPQRSSIISWLFGGGRTSK